MIRRDFLKILGIGAAAVSTTTYFDMGANLWRLEPIPMWSLVIFKDGKWSTVTREGPLITSAPVGIAQVTLEGGDLLTLNHPGIFRGPDDPLYLPSQYGAPKIRTAPYIK
jgi:hypothetical protein